MATVYKGLICPEETVLAAKASCPLETVRISGTKQRFRRDPLSHTAELVNATCSLVLLREEVQKFRGKFNS